MGQTTKKAKTRIQSYISENLKEAMQKYGSKNRLTISEITNIALQQFFKVKTVEDNLDFIVSIIENTIHKELDSKLNRLITLNAKTTKSALSSQYLQTYVLAFLFQETDDREFLKEKLKLADELGYKATKIPIADNFSEILPKDLHFDGIA